MKVLLAVLCLVSTACAVSYSSVMMEEWQLYKNQFGKVYHVDEDSYRMKIFLENKQIVAEHNKLYEEGKKTFNLAMNQFGDMTTTEFAAQMNGYKGRSSFQGERTEFTLDDVTVPETMDWRTKGAVTPVKDQGQCGSCWAFGTTGTIEGQHFLKTGKMVSLSEQELVDCSRKYGNLGCGGGLMSYAYKYIMHNNGIDTEAAYPYEAVDKTCRANPSKIGAKITGYVDIPSGNENSLHKAVGTVGPVAVAIDAAHSSFQLYHSGVYDEPRCSSRYLDHAVLAVGYGTDKKGGDFWLVKNSWAASWGDKGYIKMRRNHNNMCGIATQASYPKV